MTWIFKEVDGLSFRKELMESFHFREHGLSIWMDLVTFLVLILNTLKCFRLNVCCLYVSYIPLNCVGFLVI